jgi:transposase InsO family protein
MVGPAAKRAAVAHLEAEMGLSERRACSIVGADRKMIRYCSRRPPDIELRAQLRELANERRRFGYRRLFVLLRREGEPSGIDRIHRLYREEGLTVRKRRARRKATGTRAPILVEAKPNARWSLDFVYDQFANGRRFRVLNIVDDVTKECLGAIPDTSIAGRRVARELTMIVERRGKPHWRGASHAALPASHARAEIRKDHQYLVDRREDRHATRWLVPRVEVRAGGLLRCTQNGSAPLRNRRDRDRTRRHRKRVDSHRDRAGGAIFRQGRLRKACCGAPHVIGMAA